MRLNVISSIFITLEAQVTNQSDLPPSLADRVVFPGARIASSRLRCIISLECIARETLGYIRGGVVNTKEPRRRKGCRPPVLPVPAYTPASIIAVDPVVVPRKLQPRVPWHPGRSIIRPFRRVSTLFGWEPLVLSKDLSLGSFDCHAIEAKGKEGEKSRNWRFREDAEETEQVVNRIDSDFPIRADVNLAPPQKWHD